MLTKIMFYISAFAFMFCAFMLLAVLYLTGVGFYNGIHALFVVAMSVTAMALTGIAAMCYEAKLN